MKTAYDIIIKPVITEQSMEATEDKKYVFQVAIAANTIRMEGKEKRQGAAPAGRRASWKKAMVKLTADSKTIEFFEGMV